MNREQLELDKKMGERTPTKIVNLTGKLVAYWVKKLLPVSAEYRISSNWEGDP